MKMFVWEYVNGLTSNYHDGGGALVIADNLESARKLLGNSEANTQMPNFSASVESNENRVFIFPDAGCC